MASKHLRLMQIFYHKAQWQSMITILAQMDKVQVNIPELRLEVWTHSDKYQEGQNEAVQDSKSCKIL